MLSRGLFLLEYSNSITDMYTVKTVITMHRGSFNGDCTISETLTKIEKQNKNINTSNQKSNYIVLLTTNAQKTLSLPWFILKCVKREAETELQSHWLHSHTHKT